MFLSVLFKLVMGLIGATLLNANLPGKALFGVMVMPPWVVPIGIDCIGWLWLQNGRFGMLAAAGQQALSPIPIRAVASTDLVTAPRQYLRPDRVPLVISFGRSGNSTESIGVMSVLDAPAPVAPRLNITCNAASPDR